MLDVLRAFNYAILGYYILLNAVYGLLIIVAFRSLRRYVGRMKSVHIDELVLIDGEQVGVHVHVA